MTVAGKLAGGLLAAALLASSGPLVAGTLLDRFPEEMRAYADQAGYVLASIPVCGGDSGEAAYFKDLVRDNLRQVGADDDDIGFLDHYMREAAATARPRKRECNDEGAVPMTSEMFRHLNAIKDAVVRR